MMRSSKKIIPFICLLFCSPILLAQPAWKHGRIKVTPDGHYLQYTDGTPFFWLGDTGWELFHKLKKEEIELYLENRQQKGFNVIQSVILADAPNRYGDRSFYDNDPSKPVEKYFELVDWEVKKAMEKNMVMALLPTWGEAVSRAWVNKKEIFNEDNAYRYGLFLGKRYKDYPNIIWISGGDRPAFADSADWRPIWRALIKGIREGTNGEALITYHTAGESSSTVYWRNENTLDFNMMQSGHKSHDLPVWDWVKRDREYIPHKPILDGEPNYEDHPVNWDNKNGYFRDYDVRKQIYRSVFSGACGVTYGHHAIWQFYSETDKTPITFADRHWKEALDRPAAFQAGWLRKLIEPLMAATLTPDQTLIVNAPENKEEYMTAFRTADNKQAMIYMPVGRKIDINTVPLKAGKIKASWFNPKNNKWKKIEDLKRQPIMSFIPPNTGAGNDWVLVLNYEL
jgi:hypothetical protein